MSKREDERADDADADVDVDVDGDDEADNDDGHQDALEMLTSILQNQGALQKNQNQSSQQQQPGQRQLSASPDAAAKIGQMMQELKMADRAAAAGGGGGDKERKQHAFWDTQVSGGLG